MDKDPEIYINIQEVHFHTNTDPRIDKILTMLTRLQQGEEQMTVDLTTLKDAAAGQVTVDASVKALLESIVQSFVDAASTSDAATQAAVQEVADGILAENSDIAAAVIAHTPAAPPVDPTDPVA